jgi:hypothetical protein
MKGLMPLARILVAALARQEEALDIEQMEEGESTQRGLVVTGSENSP